ncbi:MAG: DoxX family membrane protein [Woeseiaceae bacterium]
MSIQFLSAGRIIYTSAVIGFGVICLVSVDFLNSLQPVPASMPGYSLLAVATGIILLVAGLAILANYRAYPASIALAILFALWIVALHVPGAFTDPALLRSPWWIRTFETLGLAGAALILAGSAGNPVHAARLLRAGRIAFGVSLPVFGILHFIYPESVAALVALSPVQYPWPLFWAYLTGAGHFAAGVAIATGVVARWAAILAGFMYASWALTLHLPRIIEHPETYSGDRRELTSLFVCVAFWGAAWIVAGALAKPGSSSAPA